MNRFRLIFFFLAFAKADLSQSQHSLIPESDKAFKPPVTTWHGYDVHGPVKQIEIVEYTRNKDGIIEPVELEAFVFHDNGNIDKHVEQNKYLQSAIIYNYTAGTLSGQTNGSNYGPSEINYKIDTDGKVKSIGLFSFTYDSNDKLTYTSYDGGKSDSYTYDVDVTRITTRPANIVSVFYKNQLIMRKEGKRDYFYVYTYPYDGKQLFLDKSKLNMTMDALQKLAAADVDTYNETIRGARDSTSENYPLHIFKENEKGDWTVAVERPLHDPSSHKYYFRKITYTDGSVSGDVVVDENYIKKNTKQPKN